MTRIALLALLLGAGLMWPDGGTFESVRVIVMQQDNTPTLSFPAGGDGGVWGSREFAPAPPGAKGTFIKSGSRMYVADGGWLAVPPGAP